MLHLADALNTLGTDMNGNTLYSEMREWVSENYPEATSARRGELLRLLRAASSERMLVISESRKR